MDEPKEKNRFERIEEKVDALLNDDKKKKEKKFKLPWRGRVGNSQLKKGYITVEVFNENREVDFVKEPIVNGTVKIGDTIHALDDLDIYSYKGKPITHIPKTKINPWNPVGDYINSERTDKESGKKMPINETHGQSHILARMKSEAIKTGLKVGWGLWIFLIVVGGVVIYAFLSGGK